MGFGCDTDVMINQVVPSLIYSCLSLYEARDALSGDFSGIASVYSAVAMAKNRITTCIGNVNSAKEWVIGKAVAFEEAEGNSQKVVEQLNAVKDLLTEKIKEVPRYNQLDYENTQYGNSTVKSAGCGITSYAMVLSYLLDEEIKPDELLAGHKDYHRYKVEGGSAYGLFQNTTEDWGISVETCWWQDAWNGGKVMEALKNGQPVIFNARKGSAFTQAGHYIVLYGLTDDGKILVRDPNGENYMGQGFLVDGFKNGFDPDYFKGLSEQGAYFIFNAKKDMKKNTEGVTDTEYYQAEKQLKDYLENKQANIEAIDNLVEPSATPTLEEPTINEPTIEPLTKPLTDAKPIQPIYEETNDKGITTIPIHDKWDYGHLTAAKGVIDYKSADGKHMSETWCPLGVSQLVKNIQQYEHIYYKQWTREDGVQMYGPYVIVAADVKGRKECGGVNQDATYNYGDIVETSLGTGIVMDYCGRSNSLRKETNGEQTHFDIYTDWWRRT